MAGWVRRGEPIAVNSVYMLTTSTAIKCQSWESDENEYRVNVIFGDGSAQGEVTVDLPDSLVGVLLAQLKSAVLEIRAARAPENSESAECVRADA